MYCCYNRQVFRPMLMIALEQYFQTPLPDVLKSLYDALNSGDIAGAPRPTPWERGLMRRCEGRTVRRPVSWLTTCMSPCRLQ